MCQSSEPENVKVIAMEPKLPYMVTDVIELRVPGDCNDPGGSKIPSQMLLFGVEGCNTEEQRVEKYGRERHEIRGIDLSNDATNQGMPRNVNSYQATRVIPLGAFGGREAMLTFDFRIRASGTVKGKKITVGSHPVSNNVTVHPGNKFAIDGLRWTQQPPINHNITTALIKAGT